MNKARRSNGKLFPILDTFGKETLRSKWYMVLRRCGLPKSKSLIALSWISPTLRAEDVEVKRLEIIRALEREHAPGLEYEGNEAPIPPGYAPLEVVPGAPKTLILEEPTDPPTVPLEIIPHPCDTVPHPKPLESGSM
jgi:hypothetical protein